ncbi:MAG TPA: peptidoglycan DD-metalloendopeptidase family protein [Anaerolineae bacterium]|nr:peptidoglycan DD-metalloendopeptidase family protein [Anaerolineae bacterium]
MAFRMKWPTQYGIITQKFRERPEVYRKFGLPGHEGIDFQAPNGSEIYAVADGFISDVRLDGDTDKMNKPYGNQVRIQHAEGYETIYAHLQEVVVVRGQSVKAGQIIGLADNTGNSFGAHLHFSLKKKNATANRETDYPHDLIDPTPFLDPFKANVPPTQPTPPAQPFMQVQVNSPEVGSLNVRDAPHIGGGMVEQVADKAMLGSLEEEAITRSKLGQQGQWLWVRTPGNKVGYTAAWYLQPPAGAALPIKPVAPPTITLVEVDSPETPLKLRSGPGVEHAQVALMAHGTIIKALEPEADVKRKIGQQNQWLKVQEPGGQQGYTAAWYLKLQTAVAKPVIPQPTTGKPTEWVVVESPEFGLKLREGPGVNFKEVWWVPHRTPLKSLEGPVDTGRKIAQQDQWIKVRTPAHREGYVAAWFVRHPTQDDKRQRVTRTDVVKGVSPYIYGIHAVSIVDDPASKGQIRSLYSNPGWIFFTEQCGRTAHSIGPNNDIRAFFWEWVQQGYGVVVRLNHGYEPGGTLPESRYYDDFAAAAARWVELYLKRPELAPEDYTWTIQIANEQNNPREHPGGFDHPTEHITPERYAEAFNKTYRAIKAVLPNAIVCPGAIDPYNYMPWKLTGQPMRPLEYYDRMMKAIEALDGVILHAYLHGPDPKRVTGLDRFAGGDPSNPLHDHFFDFQTYRLFLERIPGKWRDAPIYITEMNHICRASGAPNCDRDQGWENSNTGVVREIFKELDNWNQTPYAQQVRCGLLYRWHGDQWQISDRGGVLEDFRQAAQNDYRWRSEAAGGAFSFAGPMEEEEEAPAEIEERALVTPDDLTLIWGIGPKTEVILNTAGIFIFEQLAALKPEEIRVLLEESGLRPRHLATWPQQARLLLEGDKAGLQVLLAELGKKSAPKK